jgi:hypothetical protein
MQKTRQLTVSTTFDGRKTYPFLRLHGLWLEEAGFKPHSFVKLAISRGKIVITPDSGRLKSILDNEIRAMEKSLSTLKERRASYG